MLLLQVTKHPTHRANLCCGILIANMALSAYAILQSKLHWISPPMEIYIKTCTMLPARRRSFAPHSNDAILAEGKDMHDRIDCALDNH
jgi:hypothetical protein